MARPRKHVDLVEIIGRRWAGQSFPTIARSMRLGRGTVHRAYRSALAALQASQNPALPKLLTVAGDGFSTDTAEVDRGNPRQSGAAPPKTSAPINA